MSSTAPASPAIAVPTNLARCIPSRPIATPSPMLPVQRLTSTTTGAVYVHGPRGDTVRVYVAACRGITRWYPSVFSINLPRIGSATSVVPPCGAPLSGWNPPVLDNRLTFRCVDEPLSRHIEPDVAYSTEHVTHAEHSTHIVAAGERRQQTPRACFGRRGTLDRRADPRIGRVGDRHAIDRNDLHARPYSLLVGAESRPNGRDYRLGSVPFGPEIDSRWHESRRLHGVGADDGVGVIQVVEQALEHSD
jgi:hypothetical protein